MCPSTMSCRKAVVVIIGGTHCFLVYIYITLILLCEIWALCVSRASLMTSYLYLYLYLYRSIYLASYLSIHLSIYLSIYLFIYLSIWLTCYNCIFVFRVVLSWFIVYLLFHVFYIFYCFIVLCFTLSIIIYC